MAAAPNIAPNNSPSAAAHVKVPVANPFVLSRQPTPAQRARIERYGNMSSRSWTQIAGWHPNDPSAFMNAGTHEGGWPLFWVGAEPQR